MRSNALSAANPSMQRHDGVRAALSGQKPIDANNKGAAVGPGAAMDKSRELAFLSTSQSNAATLSMGKSINIFA